MAKTAGYDVHPSVAIAQSTIAGMKERTGRSLDEWVALARKSSHADEPSRAGWLKSAHGLGTNYASFIAATSLGTAEDWSDAGYLRSAARYVEQMYAGPKAALRPVYERLVSLARGLGADVKVCPCSTMVPLFRAHVFAQIKPSTLTRVDLGLALKGAKTPKRLIDTGGAAKGDRITHRIPLASFAEIDDEVERWLREAYERDGAGRKGPPAARMASTGSRKDPRPRGSGRSRRASRDKA